MFPAKFQTVLEEGAAIHLRLQIELWEDRPVWDKLAQPAVVTVFRIVLDPVDAPGAGGRLVRRGQPAAGVAGAVDAASGPRPRATRCRTARATTSASLATLGTIAEKEPTQATKAVFGDDESSVSLAAMGKMLFHAVLQVNDYLQSVSSESAHARRHAEADLEGRL